MSTTTSSAAPFEVQATPPTVRVFTPPLPATLTWQRGTVHEQDERVLVRRIDTAPGWTPETPLAFVEHFRTGVGHGRMAGWVTLDAVTFDGMDVVLVMAAQDREAQA